MNFDDEYIAIEDESSIDKTEKCTAICASGSPCKNYTAHESGLCSLHRERTSKQKEASKNNGAKMSLILKTMEDKGVLKHYKDLEKIIFGDKKGAPELLMRTLLAAQISRTLKIMESLNDEDSGISEECIRAEITLCTRMIKEYKSMCPEDEDDDFLNSEIGDEIDDLLKKR